MTRPAPLASGSDRAIRLSTAAAVLAVAGIAAYVSYGHAYAVIRAHGEIGRLTEVDATAGGESGNGYGGVGGPCWRGSRLTVRPGAR